MGEALRLLLLPRRIDGPFQDGDAVIDVHVDVVVLEVRRLLEPRSICCSCLSSASVELSSAFASELVPNNISRPSPRRAQTKFASWATSLTSLNLGPRTRRTMLGS